MGQALHLWQQRLPWLSLEGLVRRALTLAGLHTLLNGLDHLRNVPQCLCGRGHLAKCREVKAK